MEEGGARAEQKKQNSTPEISKQFSQILLCLHLEQRQPRSLQPVSGKGSLMRITNLLSPLRQAQLQPNQVLKALEGSGFHPDQSRQVRWPTAPAPPFQAELHPQDSSKGTLLPAQKRLGTPGMTSESLSSAKCIENAKPGRVRMKARACVVPGT